jgi:hypothetical protein
MTLPRSRTKTLPLRWVAIATVVFIAAYAFLRLFSGKPGKAFEPAPGLGEPAGTQRLLAIGYQRIPVDLERPAEVLPAARFAPTVDEVGSAFGGLPSELDAALAAKPALPATITGVTAPREIAAPGVYALQFTCAQPDYRTQPDDVLLFRKERQLFLLPDFRRPGGQLLARWKESVVLARFSTQGLAPGCYTVTLCGRNASKTWQFTVR